MNAMRLSPLSLPLQCVCFALYVVSLLLLPQDEYGVGGLHDKHAVMKTTRLVLALLAWLPLLVLILWRRPAGDWRWAPLGAWVPIGILAIAWGMMLDTSYLAWQRSGWSLDGAVLAPLAWLKKAWISPPAVMLWTYAWLVGSYTSLVKRAWVAMLVGALLFGLMVVVDFVVLAIVTGPHKMH
jgi:hypothetical protein